MANDRSGDDHGQRRIHIAYGIQRETDAFRHVEPDKETKETEDRGDDGRIEHFSPGKASALIPEHTDALGPDKDGERGVVGRGVDNAFISGYGVRQRKSHKAAVGIDQHEPLYRVVVLAVVSDRETGREDGSHMYQHGNREGNAHILQQMGVKFDLERHKDKTRRHDLRT